METNDLDDESPKSPPILVMRALSGQPGMQRYRSVPNMRETPGRANMGGTLESTYSTGSLNFFGGGNIYRARSQGSLGSQMSVASTIKNQAYMEHRQETSKKKLLKMTFGPGKRPFRIGMILLILGILICTAGIVVMVLQFTKRILVQDKIEFIAPVTAAVGVVIIAAGAYYLVKARMKSNRARNRLKAKPSGVLSISMTDLTHETTNADLVSGRVTPTPLNREQRTPLLSQGSTGAMTPISTLPRGGDNGFFDTAPRLAQGAHSHSRGTASAQAKRLKATPGQVSSSDAGSEEGNIDAGGADRKFRRRVFAPATGGTLPSSQSPANNSSNAPRSAGDNNNTVGKESTL